MALQFPRAPRVAPGEAVASKDLAGLAAAINDRILSGLGDMTWRLRYYYLGLFRNLRNSDGGFLFPATAEFFERYQMLAPEDGEWPVYGAGEPEGVNVTNPIGAWIYGVEGSVNDEATALGGVPLVLPDGTVPSTPSQFWELARRQRGAWDPDTGATGCPAFDAARHYRAIRHPWWQPFGKSYGDWLPTPDEDVTPCDDPDTSDDFAAPRNLIIFFTGTRADVDTSELSGTLTTNSEGMPVVTYDGTCMPGPSISPSTKYDSHVAAVGSDDLNFWVVLWDGTVDLLPREDWVEGPYTGTGQLAHTDGRQLLRGLQWFARDFRGDEQNGWLDQEVPEEWNTHAFDAQRFFTTQYLLAPQRGSEGMGVVAANYRGAFFAPASGIEAPGALATVIGGGDTLNVWPGCVSTGCLVKASGLKQPARIEVLGDGGMIASGTLSPTAGAAELLLMFPDRQDPRALQWRLPEGAVFDSAGRIDIEATELMDYKPRVWDWFLICRLGGAQDA